jgi:hypothetical protein
MVTYFLTIDHILSSDPQVLACVIPTMERAQGLLGTLKVVSDCQPLPARRVLAIIEPINVIHQDIVSKCNNIKIGAELATIISSTYTSPKIVLLPLSKKTEQSLPWTHITQGI